MSAMDAEEIDEIMAQVRLRAELEEHILATESVPPEVSQTARETFRDRRCPDKDSTP